MQGVTPQTADDWFQLAAALRSQQRWAEAALAFRQSLALAPLNVTAWCLLGMAEQNVGNYPAAEQAFLQGLAIQPANIETNICYSFLLNQTSRPQRAIELLVVVLQQAPQTMLAWLVLGHSYELLGNAELAEHASRRAVEFGPNDAAPRYQLANVLLFAWKLSESLTHIQHLLALYPTHADGWGLLALILRSFGRHDESQEALRRSLALTSNPQIASKLLAGMHYMPGITPEALLAAHREWDTVYGRALASASPPKGRTRAKGEPLRIGLLSADFGQHPTAFLVLPAIEHLDKWRCAVFCYSDRVAEDSYTARFRAAAAQWRTTQGLPPEQTVELIRADELDILFDLSGHFGERLPVFAGRAAPLQISWFGYVGTTGLSAMDGLLADAHHVRPGEEGWYTEQVLRMPAGYACFQAPLEAPDVVPLPALSSGFVTFGCFNNPSKYSPVMFDAWAEILRRVPASRLLLKFGWLNDEGLRQHLFAEFARRGVTGERLIIEQHSKQRELLATYGRVDLALDTQPYSGGLTTCESLWMGVPVVTFPGRTFAGRHSASHLTSAGYPQFIAADTAGYIELAVSWANRPEELAAMRMQMREQVGRSPLCDGKQFAADLLTLLTSAAKR